MSLWLATVRFDGRTVVPGALTELTAGWQGRAPGGCNHRIESGVAMAIGTLEADATSLQMSIVDRGIWLVADARIDDRRTLLSRLRAAGEAIDDTAEDAALLRAGYRVWGADLPDHLLGDFGFALWDPEQQRLLCARDHFGIRPLYFHQADGGVVVSNDLDCLRRIAEIDDRLDEGAIGDFLLFQFDRDATRTSTASIARLAPAHRAAWTPSGSRFTRYWQLPIEPPVHDPDFCVDGFREVLAHAVDDRMRDEPVAVSMSGGLDSTTVAALACRSADTGNRPGQVRGFTVAYRRLIADREERFADMAARALGLDHETHAADDHRLFDGWESTWVAPEPSDLGLASLVEAFDRRMASHARVVLTGHGGDVALYPHTRLAGAMLRRGRVDRLAVYLARGLWHTGRVPPLGLYTAWHHLRARRFAEGELERRSALLHPDLIARESLAERWRASRSDSGAQHDEHPWRPQAYALCHDPFWSATFERFAHPARAVAIEQAHPFFDVRVVRHALRLPAVPWCLDKHAGRRAMRSLLPKAVLGRRKTPLAGTPLHAIARPAGDLWHDAVSRHEVLGRFFRPNAVEQKLAAAEREHGATGLARNWLLQQPLHLARWLGRSHLQSRPRVRLYSDYEGVHR